MFCWDDGTKIVCVADEALSSVLQGSLLFKWSLARNSLNFLTRCWSAGHQIQILYKSYCKLVERARIFWIMIFILFQGCATIFYSIKREFSTISASYPKTARIHRLDFFLFTFYYFEFFNVNTYQYLIKLCIQLLCYVFVIIVWCCIIY